MQDQSSPADGRFLFGYNVSISNGEGRAHTCTPTSAGQQRLDIKSQERAHSNVRWDADLLLHSWEQAVSASVENVAHHYGIDREA